MRYRREHLAGRTLQYFPLLDNLVKDVSDGIALLAVIHFYCPELIRLEGTVTVLPHPAVFPLWHHSIDIYDYCCLALCRYLSERVSLHSWQCLQYPVNKGIFHWVPEQVLLSEARGPVVFTTSIKGEVYNSKNRLSPHCLPVDLDLCASQNNVMAFIAELFWWFESVKPDFVQPRDLQEIRDGTTRFVFHVAASSLFKQWCIVWQDLF